MDESICERIANHPKHANESREPALLLVSVVSEKLLLLNIDSMIRTNISAPAQSSRRRLGRDASDYVKSDSRIHVNNCF